MRYDRALCCLVDVVFWVSVESMCWLSLNGERKGCEGPWMFWPVLTLISGRRRVSWEDNKELQACRAVPFMIITFVAALAQKHRLTVACEMLDSVDHNALRKFWCVPWEVCMLGWAFLDFLLLGRLRWWEDESFCMQGHLDACGLSLLRKASLWYGLSAWVSSVYGSRSFWAWCSTESMGSLGCMTLLKATGVLNGTFDICSCLTQSRKCSSEETVRTSCAVYAALRSSVNDEWRASRWCESSSKSNQFFWILLKKLNFVSSKKKTQRIEIFSFWPKELNLFSTWLKELNPSFSTWLTEIELFLQHWLIEIELTFWTWLKELNHFSFKKYNSKYWTHFTIWLKELNPFFHMSQWIGFFLNILKELNPIFLNMTQRIEHSFFSYVTQRILTLFLNMIHRAFFFKWFKELNNIRKCNSKNLNLFLKITKLFFEYRLKE